MYKYRVDRSIDDQQDASGCIRIMTSIKRSKYVAGEEPQKLARNQRPPSFVYHHVYDNYDSGIKIDSH